MACKIPHNEWVERPSLLILVCSSWVCKWLSASIQVGHLWGGVAPRAYNFNIVWYYPINILLLRWFPPPLRFHFLFFLHHLQLACSGSCPDSSDEISPIYSLWATFIGLYIANYVVERSTGWVMISGSNLMGNILLIVKCLQDCGDRCTCLVQSVDINARPFIVMCLYCLDWCFFHLLCFVISFLLLLLSFQIFFFFWGGEMRITLRNNIRYCLHMIRISYQMH